MGRRAAGAGRTAVSRAAPVPEGPPATGAPGPLAHQLDVAAGRGGQRGLPGHSRLQRPVERGGLPGRAVDPAAAPLLDDAEVEVPVGGLHPPRVETGLGERQQLVTDEYGGVDLGGAAEAAAPGPFEARVDAVAARGLEVGGGGLERQPGPHRPGLLGERAHDPVVEGRVGDDVGDGGPGGQDAVLDTQVRDAVGDVVDGPVPAVDGAVVQDQLGQGGHAARVEDVQWVLVVADRQQRREVAPVLLEEVVGRGHPPLPEPGARPHALGLQFGRAGVGGLLEQRGPRLAPQFAPEEEGCVGAEGDLGGGHRLGRVPHVGEAVRGDLEVELHRGAGRLGRDGLGGAGQSFDALDVEGEVLPAGGHDLFVEQGVAVDGGEIGRDQVVPVQRRQNSDHRDSGVDLARLAVRVCQGRADLLGEAIEYPAAEAVRGDVDFQVEHGELRLEVTARDALEDLRIQHFRHPVGTDEIQFDLQPHQVLRAVEPLLRQKSLQARQAPLELLAVALAIGQVELTCRDLLPMEESLLGAMSGRSGRRWPVAGQVG